MRILNGLILVLFTCASFAVRADRVRTCEFRGDGLESPCMSTPEQQQEFYDEVNKEARAEEAARKPIQHEIHIYHHKVGEAPARQPEAVSEPLPEAPPAKPGTHAAPSEDTNGDA